MEQADPAVKQLAEIAYDETKSDDIRLKATLALIDRAGLTPKTSLDIEVSAKPYETIYEDMQYGGSRAAFRGEPEPEPVLELEPIPEDQAIEVEVIDPDEDAWPVPEPQPPDVSPSPFESEPPPEGLMPLQDAVSAQRKAVVLYRATRR
jgi:hypothetical protein